MKRIPLSEHRHALALTNSNYCERVLSPFGFRAVTSSVWRVFIWVGVLMAMGFASARANVPGGVVGNSGTYPAVTIVTNSNANPPTVTMSNGLVTAVIDITTAQLLTLTYAGYQVTAGGNAGNDDFYWQGQNSVGEQTGAFGILTIVTNPASNSGTMADIMISDLYSNHTSSTDSPDDAYRHFTMFRGSPGIYVTEVMARPSTYPAGGADIPSFTGKMTSTPFDWLAQDSGPQNTIMPTDTTTTIAGVNSCPKEVTLMGNGLLQGRFDCKYNYTGDLQAVGVTGWCSNKETSTPNIGLWVIRASAEYNGCGPKHPEIQTQMMNLNVTFKGVHFGFGSDLGFAAGETWSHVCGPFFLYLNQQPKTPVVSGSSPELTGTSQVALYADALAQETAEKGAWPYSWFNDNNWVPASGRGTVTGKIVISDSGNPLASASNIWVGLAQQPSSTTSPAPSDFQDWNKGYQYWVKTDGSGNFTFNNVVATGTNTALWTGSNYTLFAFGPGAAGQFQSQALPGATNPFTISYPSAQFSVPVTGGSTTALGTFTWPAPRHAPTAWEIGVLDRDTTEFRHGEDCWHGDLGTATNPAVAWNPYLNYSREFPNGLTYTTGTSVWERDWNYTNPNIQSPTTGGWSGAVQTIVFNLPKAPPANSTAYLYLSLSAVDGPSVSVDVNGNSGPGHFYPFNDGIDSMIRMTTHGFWTDQLVSISTNLLHSGSNNLQIFSPQSNPGYFANCVMCDYLRLEVPGYQPAAPSGLNVIAGNGSNVLQWTPVPGATSYNILRSTTSGASGYSLLASGVAEPVAGSTFLPASYTDTTATNGTAYYYEIASVNVTGTSTSSTFASGTPSASAPGVPAARTGLTVLAGNTQAILSWNGSAGASYYLVERSMTSGGPYTVSEYPATTTSCTDTGLTNSNLYYYTVAAVNATGTSALSTEANATPMPATVTNSPTNLAIVNVGGSPYLTWTGASGASNYIVQSATSASGPYTVLTSYDVLDNYSDTSTAPSTTYYYEVAGADLSGQSPFTSPVAITTMAAAPASLTAIPGNTQVSLTWPAMTNVTGYDIERSITSGGPYSVMGTSTGPSYTNTGLTNGTTYYYVVAGVNATGTSANSPEASATPSAAAPLAPTALSAVGGVLQIALDWKAATGATEYTLYRGTLTGGPYTAIAPSLSGTTYTDSPLSPATAYYYVVQATSATGTSAFSNEASATTSGNAGNQFTWDSSETNPGVPADGPGIWDNSTAHWSNGSQDTAWSNSSNIAIIGNGNGAAGTINVGNITAGGLILYPAGSGTYTLTTGTLTLTGSAPTIAANANVTIGTIQPGTVQTGTGTVLTGTGNVTIDGTGTITLECPATFSNTVTLVNSQLNLSGSNYSAPMLGTAVLQLDNASLDNISYNIGAGSVSTSEFSNPVYVASGQSGTIFFSTRTAWGNGTSDTPVTGSGILNLDVSSTLAGSRDYLFADFSGFTGTVNVIGTVSGCAFYYYMDDGANTADGADGSASAQWNFGGASSTTVTMSPQTTGNTMYLGSLSGGTNATLAGGSGGTVTYSMGALGLNTNFQGAITANAAVTKTGAGTQILSGPCTYTKATTVQAGVLEITGSVSSTASVSVSNGAVLYLAGGSLSVAGNVTNSGLFKISGSPALAVTGTFINQGVLDLINGPQTLPANFVNDGIVLVPSSVNIQNLTLNGSNGVSVSLLGYAQHTYQLQKTASVAAPVTWTNVGSTQTGTGSTLTFSDPAASGSSGFYRVQISP